MRTRVSSKGQIVLPAELREEDGIEPGQQFEVQRIEAGDYRLTRVEQPPNAGLVELLLACPVKDWFEPLSRDESTADFKVPSVG